jgi:NitT/TauT family transport system ATP-binding protein
VTVEEFIRVEGAAKTYESRKGPVHAIGPVDLSIRRGEFVSLVGPSGCGKSTLLMMIAGLLDCTRGRITVDGHPVTRPQTDVGIVFQNLVLVDWRDVLGNVLLQVEMRKLDVKDYVGRAKELLASVGLEKFLRHHPYELSGGMQQRTAFCRALVHDPPMVLMDEPLGALDAMTREQLRRDLEKLWMDTRKTFVFVTHDIAEAVQLSDRVVIISPRPGKIDAEISIELPRPRNFDVLQSGAFLKYVKDISAIFMGYGVI